MLWIVREWMAFSILTTTVGFLYSLFLEWRAVIAIYWELENKFQISIDVLQCLSHTPPKNMCVSRAFCQNCSIYCTTAWVLRPSVTCSKFMLFIRADNSSAVALMLELGEQKAPVWVSPDIWPSIMTRRLVLYLPRRSPTSVIAHICFMWTCDRKGPRVHLLGRDLFRLPQPPPTKSTLTQNNTGHMKRWF